MEDKNTTGSEEESIRFLKKLYEVAGLSRTINEYELRAEFDKLEDAELRKIEKLNPLTPGYIKQAQLDHLRRIRHSYLDQLEKRALSTSELRWARLPSELAEDPLRYFYRQHGLEGELRIFLEKHRKQITAPLAEMHEHELMRRESDIETQYGIKVNSHGWIYIGSQD